MRYNGWHYSPPGLSQRQRRSKSNGGKKKSTSDSDAHILWPRRRKDTAYFFFSHVRKEVPVYFSGTAFSFFLSLSLYICIAHGNKILANALCSPLARAASPHACVYIYVSNLRRAIAYPHPTISSNYLCPHSFRFMFQFRCIDTCLFTPYLPVAHSFAYVWIRGRRLPIGTCGCAGFEGILSGTISSRTLPQ